MSAPAPIRRTPDSFDAKEREVISCRALYQSHGELARVFRCSVQTITAIVRKGAD